MKLVNQKTKKHVFIVGSKGIPASYGGFETFVENLTRKKKSENIFYHVACISSQSGCYEYNGARCFKVKVPQIGSAKAIYYDVKALSMCIAYCREHPDIEKPVFYVLACRIGPFIGWFQREIRKIGGVLCVNPDGHEWKRKKWGFLTRKYWKFSERLMIKKADLVICDSRCIEKYIKDEYKKYHPETLYLSYGSELSRECSVENDRKYAAWLEKNQLKAGEYYLIVGRFVPENNFYTITREFMKSETKRSLAIITTKDNRFMKTLNEKLGFETDDRIKFVGTIYDQELLTRIRREAYAYIHGHEVGGTNPSLLEALGHTNINLIFDVEFNREVALDAAFYWDKEEGNLASLIHRVEELTQDEILQIGEKAGKRISDDYRWDMIVSGYEEVFENTGENK
ncbi:MAG: DUF1972 domain-containing protein [Lachnospiraceae bacterium]|nr:DUF1972 domain-containing protein [Robinsoniella sp.]MDY3765641.1 DUF1972 domain-containing protein [Lachnospiraceae bacterium]